MPSDKQIIAVLGSTGFQGGGVVRDLLKDGTFAVRAITRNPDSAAAKELKTLGADVVKADLDDVESLIQAFRGAHGVYGNTVGTLLHVHNFDSDAAEAQEIKQGKSLVDACKAAGVKHYVWSTLDNCKNIHVHFYNSKVQVNAYLEASGVPYTQLYTSFYYSNLWTHDGFLKKNDDGSLDLAIPVTSDAKIHSMSGADVGRWAVPIFKNYNKYLGKRVDAVAEYLTAQEYGDILRRVTGKVVHQKTVTREEFFSPEFRKATGEGFWRCMQGWVDGEFIRDFENSRSIAPNPVTFEEYLRTDSQIREFIGLE